MPRTQGVRCDGCGLFAEFTSQDEEKLKEINDEATFEDWVPEKWYETIWFVGEQSTEHPVILLCSAACGVLWFVTQRDHLDAMAAPYAEEAVPYISNNSSTASAGSGFAGILNTDAGH